jgi:hypothetical protein
VKALKRWNRVPSITQLKGSSRIRCSSQQDLNKILHMHTFVYACLQLRKNREHVVCVTKRRERVKVGSGRKSGRKLRGTRREHFVACIAYSFTLLLRFAIQHGTNVEQMQTTLTCGQSVAGASVGTVVLLSDGNFNSSGAPQDILFEPGATHHIIKWATRRSRHCSRQGLFQSPVFRDLTSTKHGKKSKRQLESVFHQ